MMRSHQIRRMSRQSSEALPILGLDYQIGWLRLFLGLGSFRLSRALRRQMRQLRKADPYQACCLQGALAQAERQIKRGRCPLGVAGNRQRQMVCLPFRIMFIQRPRRRLLAVAAVETRGFPKGYSAQAQILTFRARDNSGSGS